MNFESNKTYYKNNDLFLKKNNMLKFYAENVDQVYQDIAEFEEMLEIKHEILAYFDEDIRNITKSIKSMDRKKKVFASSMLHLNALYTRLRIELIQISEEENGTVDTSSQAYKKKSSDIKKLSQDIVDLSITCYIAAQQVKRLKEERYELSLKRKAINTEILETRLNMQVLNTAIQNSANFCDYKHAQIHIM